MRYLVDGGRIFLGLVFVCSIAGKLSSPVAFRSFRDATALFFRCLRPIRTLVAGLVIAAETAVVVMLAISATVGMGFTLAAALLSAFTAQLVGILRRQVITSCHCFGGKDVPVTPVHVMRNAALIAAALICLGTWSLAPVGGPLSTAGLLLIAGIAAILTLVTIRLVELATLFTPARTEAPR